MNTTVELNDVTGFLRRHLADVFDTMLGLQAGPATGAPPELHERMTGSVGFGGDTVHGTVYLHLPCAFARRVAGAMLGLPAEEPADEAAVNDVVGEVTNMLTGGLKSWLCDAGAPCAVSTPAIICGAFEIEASPGVQQELLVFESEGVRFVVEVHIKLN